MVAVYGMAVAVVEIVDVAVVVDSLVAAFGAMCVVVIGVGYAGAGTVTLVVMTFVFAVDMTVVQVVDMVIVDDGSVATVGVVNVGMVVVDGVGGHGDVLFSGGWFLGVGDRVEHDVSNVVVGEVVADLFAHAAPCNEPRCPQHLKVLRHGGLGGAQRVNEFVDASVFVLGELLDDLQPQRMGQRAQYL